jgi:hypothetical protein
MALAHDLGEAVEPRGMSAIAKQLDELETMDSCAVLLRAVAASNLTEQNQSNGQPDHLTDTECSDERIESTLHRNVDRAT